MAPLYLKTPVLTYIENTSTLPYIELTLCPALTLPFMAAANHSHLTLLPKDVQPTDMAICPTLTCSTSCFQGGPEQCQ